MWLGLIAAALIGAAQDPGFDFDQHIRNLPQRVVAEEQTRTAVGRCSDSEVGIVWNTLTDSPSLQTIIDGRRTDTTDHPQLAAFVAAGGAQHVYLVCRPDETIEATIFRALAVGEEGPIVHSALKFTFDYSGRIVQTVPPQDIDSTDVRPWYR